MLSSTGFPQATGATRRRRAQPSNGDVSTAALRGALTTRGSDRALLRRLYLARPQQMVKALGLDLLTATERLALVDDLSALAAGRRCRASRAATSPRVVPGTVCGRWCCSAAAATTSWARCRGPVVGGLRHLRVKVGAAPTRAAAASGSGPAWRVQTVPRSPTQGMRSPARHLVCPYHGRREPAPHLTITPGWPL